MKSSRRSVDRGDNDEYHPPFPSPPTIPAVPPPAPPSSTPSSPPAPPPPPPPAPPAAAAASSADDGHMEKKAVEEEMSLKLSDDDKLLLSLQVVGSLQKNEKLTEKNGLPSIDDRYLQGIFRWYTGDNRLKAASRISELVEDTQKRVQALLDEEFTANTTIQTSLTAQDKKRLSEECEDRRRSINRYTIAVARAKCGIENLRDTYTDNFTKEHLGLSITKLDDIAGRVERRRTPLPPIQ